MTKTTFLLWLSDQLHRDDLVGDIARDAVRDTDWPISARFADYLDYFLSLHVSDAALGALWQAWLGYKVGDGLPMDSPVIGEMLRESSELSKKYPYMGMIMYEGMCQIFEAS